MPTNTLMSGPCSIKKLKKKKKKMVSMFQSSKHALHYDKSHKILSSFKCNNFPPESVVYVWQKLSSKRKKIKKITKVSTRKSFFENIHVSMQMSQLPLGFSVVLML